MTKKNSAGTKYYAQSNVAIDGKHFAKNDEIKDVDADQLAIAIRIGKAANSKPKHRPAPEVDAAEPDPEVNPDAELTGEGAAADTGDAAAG